MSRKPVTACVLSIKLCANSLQQRVDTRQKLFRRQTPEIGVPHPFVPHGADRPRGFRGIIDSAKNGGNVIAMFESAGELRTFFRIVAKPMQQLRETPL